MGLTEGEFELASKGSHAKKEVNQQVFAYLKVQREINAIVYERSTIEAEMIKNRMMQSFVSVELVEKTNQGDVHTNLPIPEKLVPE